jgi:hypothetical protein
MKFALPKFLCRPSTLAIAFIPIPLSLALLYPASFWAMGDYEPHSLANALNMAYRLADQKMYMAMGMTNHPGVPFYLMSWLALGLTGHPLGSLSSNAITVLRLEKLKASEFMFPGQARNKPLSNMAMEMILRRMNVLDATVHGFRSSFRDWQATSPAFPAN